MGTGSAGAGALTEFLRVLILESPEAAPPFHFPNTVANAPASQVSIELKIFGPNVTITQKDPSALNALLFSSLALVLRPGARHARRRRRRVERVLRDGLRPRGRAARREARLRDRAGRGCVRPPPRGGGGTRARGATALARARGHRDRRRASEPYRFAPDPAAMERAIRGALADAGAAPDGVDLWLSSRDGVVEMDRAEARSDAVVFGSALPRELSCKDAIGEMAAAGGAQLVAACRALAGRRARAAPSSTPSAPEATSSPPCWSPRRDGRPPASPEPLRGLTLEIPVRFAECDPYGVVWHGHYVLYLEQAREALTGRFGFTAARALEMGYRVPVTRMELRYRAPARPDQTIRVTARLRSPSVARLVMDYEVRSESGELLVSARDRAGRRQRRRRAAADAALRPARPVRVDPRVPGRARRDAAMTDDQPASARRRSLLFLLALPRAARRLLLRRRLASGQRRGDRALHGRRRARGRRHAQRPRREGLGRRHRDPLAALRREDRERLQRRGDGAALRLGRARFPGALATAARRAWWLGFVAIQVINLVRVVSLFWIGAHRPALFSASHTVLWQSVVVLCGVLLFLLWASRAERRPAEAAARHGAKEEK